MSDDERQLLVEQVLCRQVLDQAPEVEVLDDHSVGAFLVHVLDTFAEPIGDLLVREHERVIDDFGGVAAVGDYLYRGDVWSNVVVDREADFDRKLEKVAGSIGAGYTWILMLRGRHVEVCLLDSSSSDG